MKKVCLVVASPMMVHFFFIGHIKALAAKYDVTVITNTDNPDFLNFTGVPVKVIPVQMARQVSLWIDFKCLIRLIYIFNREKFDLVHTLSPKSGLLGIIATWIARTPLRIHTFQGEVWITRKGLWRTFLKSMDKLVAKLASHLLVVSQSEKSFLIEQDVVRPGELEMLANGSICGVDINKFKPDSKMRSRIRKRLGIADNDKVILYVGRLNVDKGVMDLAKAFNQVATSYLNTQLLIVGPDEENIQAQIEHECSNLLNRIYFVDYTPTPEHYMAAADLLCLPSYREGFGLVLIEAAAVGLPTVGSRIYGITDAIVDNETGLLFEVGIAEDLAQKIDKILKDDTLRLSLGERGMQRARTDFSRELVESEFLKFYQRLLKSDDLEIH
jgi:glycosyltransferase involved in cell wall biosynthesis